MKDKEAPTAYLKRKGWRLLKDAGPWCWTFPPYPGKFLVGDAVATQEGIDRGKKEGKR
jgi:hypothetical protein